MHGSVEIQNAITELIGVCSEPSGIINAFVKMEMSRGTQGCPTGRTELPQSPQRRPCLSPANNSPCHPPKGELSEGPFPSHPAFMPAVSDRPAQWPQDISPIIPAFHR